MGAAVMAEPNKVYLDDGGNPTKVYLDDEGKPRSAPTPIAAKSEAPGFLETTAQRLGLPTDAKSLKEAAVNTSLRLNPMTMGYQAAKDIGGILMSGAQHLKAGMQETVDAGKNIAAGQPILPNIAKAAYGHMTMAGAVDPSGGILSAQKMGEHIAKKEYRAAAGEAAGTMIQAALTKVGAEGSSDRIGSTLDKASTSRRLIPSANAAKANFQEVMNAAKDLPVDVSEPGQQALRIHKLAQSGGTMPKVVRDFIKRVTDPERGAVTYEEGRDFYQNASRLSVDESKRLTPRMKYEVAQFTEKLGKAIGDTTEQAGKRAQYQAAMEEYHRAMKLKDAIETSKRVGKKALIHGAATAIGGGLIGYSIKEASRK